MARDPNDAFLQFRGRTPMEGLRRVRLKLAHREIHVGNAAGSVAEIALKYQFSNPRRFSAQYRVLFGNLPSSKRL